MSNEIQNITSVVNVIKTDIMQSQARAAKAVNQEMLALYYGIGRFISANTRNKNWGKGVLAQISERLRAELPGLRGFGESSLKNMRLFYEAWNFIERNSPIAIGELTDKSAITIAEMVNTIDNELDTIRQLQLTNKLTKVFLGPVRLFALASTLLLYTQFQQAVEPLHTHTFSPAHRETPSFGASLRAGIRYALTTSSLGVVALVGCGVLYNRS